MSLLKTAFLAKQSYTNETLKPGFYSYKPDHKSLPDYLVAFEGSANVTSDGLCDLSDVHGNEPFITGYMLHFIGEFFSSTTEQIVLYQRRFVTIIRDYIEEKNPNIRLKQKGNDLYYEDRKLNVSIVVPSTENTQLMHIGLNLTKDCPLNISYLNEFFQIDPEKLAQDLFELFKKEIAAVYFSKYKVRPIAKNGHFGNLESAKNRYKESLKYLTKYEPGNSPENPDKDFRESSINFKPYQLENLFDSFKSEEKIILSSLLEYYKSERHYIALWEACLIRLTMT